MKLRLLLCASALLATNVSAQDEPVTSTITGNIFRPVKLDATDTRIRALAVAEGFLVSVFARGLDAPRMMAVGPEGRVYVTRRGEEGDVVMLEDKDNDGTAEEPRTVLRLPHVHGIAIKEGTVFLATVRELAGAPIH